MLSCVSFAFFISCVFSCVSPAWCLLRLYILGTQYGRRLPGSLYQQSLAFVKVFVMICHSPPASLVVFWLGWTRDAAFAPRNLFSHRTHAVPEVGTSTSAVKSCPVAVSCNSDVAARTHARFYVPLDLLLLSCMWLSAHRAVSCTSLRKRHGQRSAVPSCSLLHDTAREVNHMHAKGKVHRDVKAGNIVVVIANPFCTALAVHTHMFDSRSG